MDGLRQGFPNSWAMVKLGQFVTSEKGKKPKNESKTKTDQHTMPYIDIEAFEEGVYKSWTDGVGCRICSNDDFLMVWDGSRSGLVGKGVNGALGSTLVRINFPSMVNDFAYYFLLSKYQEINTRAKGSGTPHVDPDLLWNYDFPIAPKNEQHRIVAKIEELFSELDNGIASLKTAQQQLKIYRQALLKHAFEGKLTAEWRAQNKEKLESAESLLARITQERTQRYQQQLKDWETAGKQGSKPKTPNTLPSLNTEVIAELPELPVEWVYAYLSDLGSLGRGKSKHRPRNDPKLFGGKYPFIQTGEVKAANKIIREFSNTYSEFGLQQSKLWPSGTLCITIAANIAETAFLGFDGCFPDSVVGFTAFNNVVYSEYVDFFIQAARTRIEAYAPATAQKNINLETLENLVVPYCGVIEQKLVLDTLEERFSEIVQLEQTIIHSLQQAEALRQSILKKAFSGQLVAQDVNDEPATELLTRIKAEKDKQAIEVKPRKPRKAENQQVVKTNVVSFPAKIPNISATDLHAGIIAMALNRHEKDGKLLYFGHVKAEKISHLIESHLGIDLERAPIKDAAGPNDYPHLKKVESRARKANWFDVQQQQVEGAYTFTKKHGFDALVDKTTKALADKLADVDKLLTLLLPLNTKQAEIVATLYAAWNNLLLLGQSPTDEQIVYEARENWHESKLGIEKEKFIKGLQWMRDKELIPLGTGKYIDRKGKKS